MIKFAFYIHNHQPAGNFDAVYEHAYTHSYYPLLKALTQHKKIKFGIHNSGTLLEWITEKHPDFIEILKDAVKRGQAEILSSAYAEPLLTFIPKKDMIEQIKYFSDYLYEHFEYHPKGLWLTERVWEPSLISPLLDAGIEYILLDDTHFFYAGLEEKELYSYCITEDEGRLLKIFPISMKLRYLIPFHPIDETIKFLREEANTKTDSLKTLGDDGEKFGVWPGTYQWVYEKGWLDEFLSRLEKEAWIQTVLLRDIIDEPPAGRIYLPTSSYEEMGEWVLSPERAREYEELKRTVDSKYYYLIHGGYFKNFLRKYPEANLMHKRMLYVSKNMNDDMNAKLSLWKGQCSCAYWHGIFGGLYLPHLREAVYRNLIEAEKREIKANLQMFDFDADGEKEMVYTNKEFFIVLKPQTASFMEIDDRKRKMNLLNYLGRHKEKYHQRLPVGCTDETVKSIHDIFQSKEQNLQQYLIYDQYARSFGLDWMFESIPTKESFRRGEQHGRLLRYERYKIVDKREFIITFSGEIEKRVEITGKQGRTIQLSYEGDEGIFGVELSYGIFHPHLRLNGSEDLTKVLSLSDTKEYSIEADNFTPIITKANEPFNLLTYPIETVSSSESGFEKIFQGISLMLIFNKLPVISIEL